MRINWAYIITSSTKPSYAGILIKTIFVFSKSCRGKGLGKTLVWASTYLLHNAIQLEWFFAGMEIDNIPSNKSFLSCGFKNIDNSGKDYKVKIKISDLKKPAFIKKVVI